MTGKDLYTVCEVERMVGVTGLGQYGELRRLLEAGGFNCRLLPGLASSDGGCSLEVVTAGLLQTGSQAYNGQQSTHASGLSSLSFQL